MAYAWVQTVVNGATNINQAPITPTAGNCIVVLSATSAGGGSPSVTFADSASNPFTVAIAAVADAAGNWYSLHVLANCVGGITNVAGTYNGGTPGTVNIWAIEYSGIATSSPLIGTPVQNHQASPGTVADAITGTALNVTSQPAAVIGISVDESGLSFVAGTGYTQRSVSTAHAGFVAVIEDKRITATGNNTATFTTTHGTDVFQSFTMALAEALPNTGTAWSQIHRAGPGKSPGSPGMGSLRFYQAPQAHGLDVVAVLTGQAATSATGTLSPATDTALTGQSATFTSGTLTLALSLALTGQKGTFTAGTVSPSVAVTLTGLGGVLAAGTLTPNAAFALTGQAGTLASGTLVPNLALALVGQSATVTSGLLLPNTATALSGQQAVFTAGTVIASSGGDVTLSLTGQAVSLLGGVLVASGGDVVIPVVTETPAGRRRRAIYFVTIDGVRFECASVAQAIDLLNQAKETARKQAEDEALWAVTLSQKPKPKALPKITVSSRDLRPAVTAAKREIQVIYEQAAATAEIRMLMELAKRESDEDDALLLLM